MSYVRDDWCLDERKERTHKDRERGTRPCDNGGKDLRDAPASGAFQQSPATISRWGEARKILLWGLRGSVAPVTV